MRLRVLHETIYRYATPAQRVIQNLRLAPRGHDGQFVANWRIDVDRDCRVDVTTDPFGNTMHSFVVEGPLDSLAITVGGEVETHDMEGMLRGQLEPLPISVFLRDTALTMPDAAIRDFAETTAASMGGDRLRFLHALMLGIGERLRLDIDTAQTHVSAAETFADGHGLSSDFAHVFCAAARHVNIPSRYVSGYLYRPEHSDQRSGHAWAEAFVSGLGWIGFDAANAICPTDAHIRVAVGLDHLGAAPVRGSRYGGAGESVEVRVDVGQAVRTAR